MTPADDPFPSSEPESLQTDLASLADVNAPDPTAGEAASEMETAPAPLDRGDGQGMGEPPFLEAVLVPPDPRIGLGPALVRCLELVLFGMLFGVPVLLLGRSIAPATIEVVQTGNALAVFLASLFVVRKRCRPPGGRTLGLCRPRVIHVVLALLLAPPLAIVAGEVGNLAARGLGWTGTTPPPPASIELPASSNPLSLLELVEKVYADAAALPLPLALIVCCLLPALGEELFFRGFLGRGLVARYGPVAGIIITCLLFGTFHLNPVRIAATTVLGVALHAVYLATRSLWIPILLHLVNNVIWVAETKLMLAYGFDLFGQGDGAHLPVPFTLTAAATVAVLVWTFYRTRTRWVLPDGADWTPGYASGEAPPPAMEARPEGERLTRVPLLGLAVAYASLAGAAFMHYDAPVRRASLLIAQGNARLEAGDMDGAVAAYDEAVRLDPENALGYCNRGLAYLNNRDWDRALIDLDRAVRLDPTLPEAHNGRGQAHHNLGTLDLALRDYTRTLALRPTEAGVRQNRGKVYLAMGEWASAVTDFTDALTSEPGNVEILTDRADAYSQQKDYVRAATDLTAALRKAPDDAAACRHMAWLCAADPEDGRRDPRRAVELALRSIERGGESEAYALGALACAYAARGQFEEAIRWQQKALRVASAGEKAFYEEVLALYERREPYRLPSR